MGVDKVIVRAALSTLAAIGILFVFMIVSLCAVFPSTMMQMTYNIGMESASIHFAERAYKDSKDVHFIAFATEVAVMQDKSGKISTCGEKLITHKDFETYCALKEVEVENYEALMYGSVCTALYENGKAEKAVNYAYVSLDGGFPLENAMVDVLVAALKADDSATVTLIGDKLATVTAGSETEQAYLDLTLSIVNK